MILASVEELDTIFRARLARDVGNRPQWSVHLALA